jgi:hypothetical protein
MPRRPPVVMPRIPLFLIIPVLKKELKRAGEELVRIVVRRVKGNSYDISVHTQGIEHPLRAVQRALRPCRKGATG